MPTDQRAVLASIRRFDQLIAYLRDEMGWPITRDSFEDADDLFYDFTAEELGIDPKTAAKIESIKRLRPLSPRQPWGIFFVKFEPKRLPIVALRRILSQVALKKRASANSAERAAWATDDLLFVSNYGEGDQRQISFAHFSQDRADELPTLKVLGWDNLDTPLHLDQVAEALTEQLAWPDDETDVAKWRETWRSAFTVGHREVITTSKVLAIRLAHLARMIRDRIQATLAIETETGPVTHLLKAFQESLIHDLTADDFADMYAQTVAYGLLSARITNPKADSISRSSAQLPVTNPFLKELMETFLRDGARHDGVRGSRTIDFDELGIGEVVELLDDANMGAVVRDFGDRNPQEDPVIHFYELFLKEYDAKKRMQRGVFYTPRPVVSYIIRSVHALLRTEFGLEDGLADISTWGEMATRHESLKIPDGVSQDEVFVQILDPATGTGTFLVEAIDLIHSTLVERWRREGHHDTQILDLWNDYVPTHLLPRLNGYELLMAPYAIAHLKMGLKLHETGYRFQSDERARIYLTNSLEPAHDFSGRFEFAIPALAHEAQAVNEVKRHKRFTVVIGNPPYSNFGRLNKIPFILDLLEDYKRGLGEKKLNLDDDCIKFIRFGQWLIQASGQGVLAMITSNTYIDGITHRRMRQALAETFGEFQICNLHGNSRKKETTPSGGKDENVFDIQQGVAISLLSRTKAHAKPNALYSDLWGLRSEKYATLSHFDVKAPTYQPLNIKPPGWFLAPKDLSLSTEYERYLSLSRVFPTYGSGIQTKRDALTIQYADSDLETVLRDFAALSVEQLRAVYALPADLDWTVQRAKDDLARNNPRIVEILYRPFDIRKTLWTGTTKGFMGRPRADIMSHMLRPNLAMIIKRQMQNLDWSYASPARNITESAVHFSTPSNPHFFPLYFYNDVELQRSLFASNEGSLGRRANISPDLISAFSIATQLDFVGDGSGDLVRTFGPEDVFGYVYAIFYSPTFRKRYAEFLKIDFPRVPPPDNRALFVELVGRGKQLVALHLMESQTLNRFITAFTGPKNPEVGRVGWSNDTVWLDAVATKKGQPATPGTIGFRGVPEAVWNFHIGGYQVCEKWLKDRKGRTLSEDDLAHYQKIVVALSETIRRMKEIDEVIEQHGGWPGAFQTAEEEPAGLRKVAEPGSAYVPTGKAIEDE